MQADGHLHDKERRALVKVGKRRGLSAAQVETVIRGANGDNVELPVPTNALQAQKFIKQMVRASLIDGNVSREEKQFLLHFASSAELSPADVRMTIARERRREYQRARKVLRQQPPASSAS